MSYQPRHVRVIPDPAPYDWMAEEPGSAVRGDPTPARWGAVYLVGMAAAVVLFTVGTLTAATAAPGRAWHGAAGLAAVVAAVVIGGLVIGCQSEAHEGSR